MGKITAFCSKNTTEFSEISRWRWSECWGGDSPARHCRFVPATVKTVPANVGERHAAPGDALAVRTNRRQNGNSLRFVIARRPQADVAISGRQLRFRRKCPVIHPGSARLHPKGTSSRFALRAPRRLAPHNDKSGVITVLTGACTSRQRCAGSGMPLPYNSGCGRRNCFKICNCQWRSVSAATDAIGLCVFAGSLYELQVPAVFRLRILPPVRQRMRNRQNFGKFLCFFIMACYNESAE